MLIELKIENFGIIDSLQLRCGPGLNVFTGETGAGKSLILGAVDAVLGARTGTGVVRNGSHRAAVEALFDTSRLQRVNEILTGRGIPLEDHFLSIRREIHLEGRSRPTINGMTVTLGLLRSLAPYLVDIHGQHEHQRLLDTETHLQSLDTFAGTGQLADEVGELYHQYATLRNRLRMVTLESDERERRLDYLRFALDEIESFEPAEQEFQELTQEKALIENSGKLYLDLCQAYALLREQDQSVSDSLEETMGLLSDHSELLNGLESYIGQVREAGYLVESVADYLRTEKESLQFSPERLEDVEERLVGYQKLHKKYGGSTAAVLQTQQQYLREMSSIEMSEEELSLLRSRQEVVYTELLEKAEELSRRRRAIVPALEERLAEELSAVGMPGARIQVAVRREVDSRKLESKEAESFESGNELEDRRNRYVITEKGLDRVEFLLAANAGEGAQALRKVASGGELSRITLALKTIFLGGQPTATMIFDEVDAGVGGEVAHAIGNRLRNLARQGQVVVVTHLHQIASLADHHYRIYKEVNGGRTASRIRRLQGDARLKEMARMLGGESAGRGVMEHARELLARTRAS
ncbi:MAG: DNA repair protein RecN [Leptospiraceae bacterium]|nr:DNA repair protein RecN [Leptospiraceae bacterium]MCB1316630.1 DNA repair protein RecN [Leptospiraceae bacterium]